MTTSGDFHIALDRQPLSSTAEFGLIHIYGVWRRTRRQIAWS
jgi:hypothetical protein